MAWDKRRNKIFVRCANSANPLINGSRAPERTPATPMNEVEPNVNQDFLAVDLGWDESAIVTVEQDLPKPLNIIAIMGEAEQESL